MSDKDGGPAFPQMLSRLELDEDEQIKRTMIDSTGGMSLRDYFAGQAVVQAAGSRQSFNEIAAAAYRFADAMLAERIK